ncbi:MAG: RNA polymerase sigma factor [Microbacterium sp.]
MTVADLGAPAGTLPQALTVRPVTDEARFEAAVAPLIPELVRYFARRVQPTEDAADCAAETALVMWRQRRRLPAETGEQRMWAFGIARNILANHTRKRVRRSLIDDALRATIQVQEEEISDAAFAAAEALKVLPAPDQELIRLIVWDELTIAEAGTVMGLRAATARKRYERARARLRDTYRTIWPTGER